MASERHQTWELFCKRQGLPKGTRPATKTSVCAACNWYARQCRTRKLHRRAPSASSGQLAKCRHENNELSPVFLRDPFRDEFSPTFDVSPKLSLERSPGMVQHSRHTRVGRRDVHCIGVMHKCNFDCRCLLDV